MLTALLLPTDGAPDADPLVFAHGFMGFQATRYFVGVFEHLETRGCVVAGTAVPPLGSVAQRAVALATQVRNYCDTHKTATGEPVRVNIVAHSMGGLDARYAVSQLGLHDCVASITTVSTPHRGSTLAMGMAKYMVSLLEPLRRETGLDLTGILHLTPEACETFNNATPDHADVAYFSVAGVHDQLAPTHPFYVVQKLLRSRSDYADGDEDDGMVTVGSAEWGNFLGVIENMDHVKQCVTLDKASRALRNRMYSTIATSLAVNGL